MSTTEVIESLDPHTPSTAARFVGVPLPTFLRWLKCEKAKPVKVNQGALLFDRSHLDALRAERQARLDAQQATFNRRFPAPVPAAIH